MMKKVLIINEDDEEAEQLQELFVNEITKVVRAINMDDALAHFLKEDFTLIILDANLSIEDDHRLLKAMRKMKNIPILVISSQIGPNHRLEALKAGAHVYMGKPYTLEECLAQAQSLMQMHIDSHPADKGYITLVFGKDLVIHPEKRKVFLRGNELHLTRKEFDLLFCLASNPGQVFTREQLYDSVWDDFAAYNVDDVVKTHIKTLRQKLSVAEREYIKNVWGVGYRFHDETDS